jgi:rhodanese-related sulfurtransferase
MKLPLFLLPLILVSHVIADLPPPRSAVFINADAPKAIALVKEDAAASKADPKHIPLTILDVRTPAEFAASRLQGAKNLDANSPSFKDELAKLDKSKPYLVHCGAGGRSSKARDLMKSLGFTHVTHLDGGLKAWKAAGGPLVEGRPADPAPPKAPKN